MQSEFGIRTGTQNRKGSSSSHITIHLLFKQVNFVQSPVDFSNF